MRKYLATIIINAVVALSLMSIAAGSDVLPNRGLYEVSHERVELRGGFWGPRLKTHHEMTIGHALDCLERNGHVTNFDKAAGVFDGPLRGHHAFDSDIHKAMEGAMYSLQHRDNPKLRQRVEDILDRILAAQQKDGFLISYFIVNGLDKKWEDLRLEHQMYNAGHFFEMAVEHHRLSGEKKAIDAAKRFADHIDSVFGPGKRYDVGGHEEIELALIKLYCATGERRYLELSRFFLDERGHLHGTERRPFESGPLVVPERIEGQTDAEYRRAKWHASLRWRNGRMQDHKPLVEQTEAVGHAVRAGYIYSAMVDIARFMDAPEYERAVDNLWQDVVSSKMYVNGSIGTAQYGDEGFGDPYLLPNRTYCESCSSIAHVFWQHRMNLLKAQAKYADVMELTLYNGVLSGISLSGDGFFYQNPLESKGSSRSSWIGLACCPTNLTRIIPQVGGLAYAQGKNRLYVNLFASGDASVKMDDGVKLRLAQETNYPWDGHVKLTVTPEQVSDFDLCLRIPGWALGRPVPSDLYRFADSKVAAVGLKVNGKTIDVTPEEDGYVHLKRSWKAADTVELDMPMPIRRVYAHEKVLADQGKVSLMRGPITYCIEAVDNPNVDVPSIALPREAELHAEHRDRLLGGVTVLQGKGLDDRQRPVTLTAVPYYSWANREKGAMTIWINEVSIASTALPATSSPTHAQRADQSAPLKQAGKSPVKLFILADQSNMEDHDNIKGEVGNLRYLLQQSPKSSRVDYLADGDGAADTREFGEQTLELLGKTEAKATGPTKQFTKDLRRDRYLLLDSRIIESTDNAKLTVGAVRKDKNNPLFKEDKPWEPRFDNPYCSVIYDREDKLYKCWYSIFIQCSQESWLKVPREKRAWVDWKESGDRGFGVCYATSKDGIHWEKPELGIIEFQDSTKNNIVLRAVHGVGVIKDLQETDPQKRYKAIHPHRGHTNVWFSPDGLHWTEKRLPGLDHGDTYNCVFWDPSLKKYVLFTRNWGGTGAKGKRYGSGRYRRESRSESPDFLNWSKAKVVIEGLDTDMQIHDMPVFRHAGVYIGLVGLFDTVANRQHVELAWSPDSIEWHRICPGTPLIANSQHMEDYDWGCIFASPPIFRNDEILLYYGANNGRFMGWRDGFFCLARLRPDGFAGYEQVKGGSNKTATITTKPVLAVADSLCLSADVAMSGYVKVILFDKENKELAQNELISKTVTDAEVQWPEGFSFRSLKGSEIRFRFELRDARLYSFSFHQ